MRIPRTVITALLLVLLGFQVGCSSSSGGGDDLDTAGFEDSELDEGLDGDIADEGSGDSGPQAQEQSEDDLLEESLAETPAPQNADEFADFEDPGQEELPPPPVVEEAPPEPVQEAPMEQASAPAQTTGPRVTITAVDYKANENGGTVVIKTSQEATVSTRANPEKNQFVVEILNATLPAKFKRPFNTKEFSGAIGMINGYQDKGSTTARFVIQLREPIEPTVQQEGNSVLVMALGGGGEQMMAEAPAPEVATEEAPAQVAEEPATSEFSEQALQGKTLDDFLSGNMKFYGRPISIQVKDGDIRDIFNFISEESGLNLVLSDEVTGKISLKLREIPWDQALVVVMQSKQLGYIRQGNILRVAPLKAIRAESDATKDVIESQRSLQPLRVKVFPISYAAAKDLEGQVTGFLTPRGKVRSDTRTNTLIVNDIAEVIQKVGKLLVSLDAQTPQVMIEGKVIEARDNFEQQIGLQWNYGEANPKSTGIAGSPTSNPASLSVTNSKNALEIGPLVGKLFSWDTVAAKLSLFEREAKIKVLSSPKIITLNNVKATIEQTSEIPIFATTISNGVPVTTVTYKQAKLQLVVTPQITAEGGVIMNVSILREFFDAEDTAGTTGARALNTRQAQTTVLVGNGETAVIGGIYQSDATEAETGVPLLRKIPIIGKLFSGSKTDSQKNELLIFLSPRVLNVDKAFGAAPPEIIDTEAELGTETEQL